MSYADNSFIGTTNSFVSTAGSIGVSDPPCVPVELDGNTFTGLSAVVDPVACIAPGALAQ